jgi:hypothetical protein
MNERIRELAEQADPEHWHKRWYSGINPRVMDPEIKKFAELIVQECVMLCDKVYEQNDNVKIQAGATFCREDIKQHFGVEE